MADNLETVRRLWEVFQADGMAAVLERTPPDVVWEPFGAEGRPLRGAEVRDFLVGLRDELHSAQAYGFEAHGDCVLVSGALRVERGGHLSERQLVWVYFFRGDRLMRAAAYPSRGVAMTAIEAFESASGGGAVR